MFDWQMIKPHFSDLAGTLVILILAGGLSMLLGRLLNRIGAKARLSEYAIEGTRSALRWLVFLLALLFILQQYGVNMSAVFSALLAVGGLLAVGFIAVWSVLSNLLCALLLLVFRPFQVGDDIEIIEVLGGSGLRGRILKFNLMYTTIAEKVDDQQVLTNLPNNVFFQKAIRKREQPKVGS